MTLVLKLETKGVQRTAILLLILLSLNQRTAQNTEANMDDSPIYLRSKFAQNLSIFALKVYNILALAKPKENIVFSPFSIQACAAMARLGAEKRTAEELDKGLVLVSSDESVIATSFNEVLSRYQESNILKIANKIYIMQGYKVQETFNDILTKKFYTSADEIDFSQNEIAAKMINEWVEQKTNNLIKNLISPNAVGSATRLVLLNAIYFKGQWEHKFRKQDTRDEDFYLNESDTVKVPMMNIKQRFKYAELPEIDATALEMTYKDSDLSMLVLLPNSRTGLKSLEENLRNISLPEITGKMHYTQVIVKFPKFKAEFEIELKNAFEQLGMPRMFSSEAEFGKMLETQESFQISKVIHKAFIDVNEEGTEAAAATAIAVDCIDIRGPPVFEATKPFKFHVINYKHIRFFEGCFKGLQSI